VREGWVMAWASCLNGIGAFYVSAAGAAFEMATLNFTF